MKQFFNRCERFSKLCLEARDRELSVREQAFVSDHRDRCEACRAHENESKLVLTLLVNSAFELEIDDSFDARVLRLAKVSAAKDSLRYWAPAIVGAAIACMALTASLQLVSRTSDSAAQPAKGSEARLTSPHRSRQPLDLNDVPPIR